MNTTPETMTFGKFCVRLIKKGIIWVFAALGIISTILQFFIQIPWTGQLTGFLFFIGFLWASYKVCDESNLLVQQAQMELLSERSRIRSLEEELFQLKNPDISPLIKADLVEGEPYAFKMASKETNELRDLRNQLVEVEEKYSRLARIAQETSTVNELEAALRIIEGEKKKELDSLHIEIQNRTVHPRFQLPEPVLILAVRVFNDGLSAAELIATRAVVKAPEGFPVRFTRSALIGQETVFPYTLKPRDQITVQVQCIAEIVEDDALVFASTLRDKIRTGNVALEVVVQVIYRNHNREDLTYRINCDAAVRPMYDAYLNHWSREGFVSIERIAKF